MKTLAILIGSCINWVIFIFAIVTLGGLIYVAKETMDLKKKIDDDQKKRCFPHKRRARATEGMPRSAR